MPEWISWRLFSQWPWFMLRAHTEHSAVAAMLGGGEEERGQPNPVQCQQASDPAWCRGRFFNVQKKGQMHLQQAYPIIVSLIRALDECGLASGSQKMPAHFCSLPYRAHPYTWATFEWGKGWKQGSNRDNFHPSLTPWGWARVSAAEPRFSQSRFWIHFSGPCFYTPPHSRHMHICLEAPSQRSPALVILWVLWEPFAIITSSVSLFPPASGLHEYASEQWWDRHVQCHPICPGPDSPEDQNRR